MLKDVLKQIVEHPEGQSRDCKLGRIISSQDQETAELLIQALAGPASTMSLVRALNEEGLKLSREYLGQKRSTCFKGTTSSEKCCLNFTDEEDTNNG